MRRLIYASPLVIIRIAAFDPVASF